MSHPLPHSTPSSSSRPTARRRWWRWTAVALAAVVVAVGVGRALNKRQTQRAEADAAATRLQAPVVYALTRSDTVTARSLTLTQTVAISGTVKATQTAVVKAKVAGEVQGLQVREGDTVHAGQVLGRIDTTEYQARVQQAEQQAQAAQTQVDIAQRAWANNQALVNQGFISKTALDTSASTLEGAQANHRAALAALDVARKSLTDTALRSPLSGQVAARLVQNGERVAVDARVLDLVDLRELELEVALAPADAARVSVGQTATLTVEGLPQAVQAKVARISPSAQAASRSILAYLKVAPAPGLRHGLFANGTIALGPVQGVAVPASTVRNDRPQPYVQWLRPVADATDGAQAEVVHQPVRVIAQGQGPDTADGTATYVILDSIADNALLISGRSGFFQEKTRVRTTPEPTPPPLRPRPAMWFTQVSLRNPVFATMVMLAFVVLGLFAIQRMQVDQFPNIDFPVVVVTTEYPGAAPEIVETEVTQKVEEAVNTIAGINALTSRSYESQSVVIIEFGLHIEGRKAAEDVREKIALLKPSLRTEVKDPKVLRFDPAARAVWSVAVLPASPDAASPGAAAVRSPSHVELTQWAEQTLKKRLENVRGVGAVTVVGGTSRAIQIELDPKAMEALGITADQVVAAVRTENQDAPLGTLRTLQQEKVVQLQSRVAQPQDLANIIVSRRGGQAVRLGQVARVVDSALEQENLALYNGERTLLLQVQKTQDENTIEVVNGLQAALKDIQAQAPTGIQLREVQDGSRPIKVGVANVRQTLIEGAFLTVLIVFLFLNSWRSTLITGLTLPIALVGTFMVMKAFGFTINMLTLMALSLSVGLLIDDAIVVRENIVRHLQMGKTAYNAAMDGTQEIGLAVLATSLSIVAVFLPIGFMEGIIGKFFHEFGVTVAAAILISMFVSFTLDPMLSSVWHDPSVHAHSNPDGTGHWVDAGPPKGWYDRSIGRVTGWIDRMQDELAEVYRHVLAWALQHKLATLVLATGVFVTSVLMVPLLGTEFVPKADFSETSLTFHTPVGSSLEATEAKARQVEAIVREFPEVRYTLSTLNVGNAQGKIYANIYIRLVDRKDRTLSADQMSATLRERLRSVGGINVTHVGLLDAVGGNKQVEFSLQGADLKELERLAQQVMARIRPIPGLVDLDSSVKPDKPTVELHLKADAASDLGVSTGSLASALRTLIAGQTVGNWRDQNDETHDVIVRLPPNERRTPELLASLPVVVGTNADGSARVVRVGQVADVVASTGANQINRRSLTREVAINANVYGRTAGEVSADIRKALDETAFPPGYRYQFGGSTKNMQESFGYAVSALAMAVIFIYMILASQFKSFLQPLALMTSLPLTLIGVVLALMMFGSSLSMFSVIGVIMLMGLVTKNAILLVDFAIRAREGTPDHPAMGRTEALLLAAKVRLRPILMTTLAMVFGMVPLAFALSEGSEQRAPMGQAVIGGVITSSILTLVVVPVVYCYMDDLGAWLRRKLGPRKQAHLE